MTVKYLFIDDEAGAPTKALIDGFNDTGLVYVSSLSFQKNESFENVCKMIGEGLINGNYDGIILDLCLDGTGANSLYFKAPPLAQQIRTLSSEGKIKHIPVVLCSTNENYELYIKDSTSHDLFDSFINKTTISFEKESLKLQSLAEGYKLLNDNRLKEVYLNRTDFEALDDRVIDFLSGEKLSSFDIAQRILKDLFYYSGILIDEYVMAARLGIDIKTSSIGWNKLKEELKRFASYNGVFSKGWSRFWADKVNAFFMEQSEGNPYQIMTANERVEILQKAGYDNLIPAKPIQYNNSTYYDTVCLVSKCPMDSMEGIPVEDIMSMKPWQENHYVSFFALAKGDYPEGKVCNAGIKRFNDIKLLIKDEQVQGK